LSGSSARDVAAFPDDLTPYALIVQCGGCTVTRKQILVRQYRAARQGVPMSNYGTGRPALRGQGLSRAAI